MEIKNNRTSLVLYGTLLSDIKTRIRHAQVKATLSANAEMIAMYWDVGRMIYERQQHEGWGTGVIPRLAKDIRNELPKVKGFSERNIGYMIRFAREYGDPVILQQAVAKLQQPENKDVLKVPQAVGQLPVNDFYIDLLFYHLKLRCFIVIELKKGDFKPEYAGKMNFYCSAVDDYLKHQTDQPTIGLILCQTKDRILAEYALRDVHKPIGISEYELTRSLPDNLKSSLPSIEEIEAELSGGCDE